MIVVKLKGGLGNQMFQYAFARVLIKNKESIYVDLEFLNTHNKSNINFTARNYELGIFKNCRIKKFSNLQRNLFFDKKLRFRILRKILIGEIKQIKQIGNETITYPIYFKNLYIDGYFQSEKYFNSIKNAIINEFSFPKLDHKNRLIQNQILLDENSVSIHIRRGDYLKPPVLEYHGVLPISYYYNAIEIIRNKYKDITFYFFSDDEEFVKNNFTKIEPKIYIYDNNGENSWKDMYLMKSCKHHIIANSSFSWWGAWLSDRDGITCAPKYWFNPKIAKFEISDFVPKSWHIINYD